MTNINDSDFVLNEFGKEDISYITDEIIGELLETSEDAVKDLMTMIYCNPDHPENNTMFKEELDRDEIQVHIKGEWVTKKQDKILREVINRMLVMLKRHYYNMKVHDLFNFR